jgi:hypothetical protein
MEVTTVTSALSNETYKVFIKIGEIDYRITDNKDGSITINKMSYGAQNCAMSINPKASNEVILR